jgi:AraC-like DNA-binding protein
MLNGEYLRLQLYRLRGAEEFAQDFEGLCFVFPKGGRGYHVNGGSAQPLAPGDVLILRESTQLRLTTGKDGDFVFWTFSLRPEHLFPLFDGKEIALLNDVLEDFTCRKHYLSNTSVAVDSHRLLTEVSPNPTLDHRGQLLRIAAGILSDEFRHAHLRTGFIRAEEHILQVFESLSADQILNFSIQELADKFSCSRRHLNRLFHHFFGSSAAALKTEMRLIRAASLLRDPNSKVITVAQQCGFNHLGLFNTSFRRRFNVSPGQWRDSGGRVESKPSRAMKPAMECMILKNGLCPWMGKVAGLGSLPVVPIATKCGANGNGNGHTNGNGSSNGGPDARRSRQRVANISPDAHPIAQAPTALPSVHPGA